MLPLNLSDQPLTRVSIPQHEPSEAWGGTGSWHHNGSGFTIATVGPGPLLLLMLPLPYTRQLSHWGGRHRLRDARMGRMAAPFGARSRCRSYFPVNQLIELQYSVLLAAAPALPSPFQGLTHSSARSRGHPIVAVVQCDWTTVCCFGTSSGGQFDDVSVSLLNKAWLFIRQYSYNL